MQSHNTQHLQEEIDRILTGMSNTGHDGDEAEDQREPATTISYNADQEQPGITVHVHHFTDAIVIPIQDQLIVIPAQETPGDDTHYVDTTLAGATATQVPQPPQGKERGGAWLAYAPVSVFLLLVFSTLAFQLHLVFSPPIAQITIIPKSVQVSLSTTLSIGRVLAPLTLSQSATASATGKGHQDSKQAQGSITFYNGQLNNVFIPAGTQFTGNDGTQIVTDQDANIPSASPPTEGQVTVPAHAINAGTQGNIPARDINTACCATAVLAINLTPFQGGANERNFHFVTKPDIENAAIPLKAALTQSVTAALKTQLKQSEQLQILPCAPQVSADHQINEEANQVKVTATLMCSGVAYNENTLQQLATKLLSSQALKELGSGYSLFGTIQVTVTRAIVTHNTTP